MYITNTGAAFGFFHNQNLVLTIVAIIGISLILLIVFLFSRRLPFLNTAPERFVLGLVLGGTAGNLIDRLRFGYVTDFISVGVWPVFNIADSSLTIGIILFAYLFLTSGMVSKTPAH